MNYVTSSRIAPERWPAERPLFVLVLLVSILVWIALVVTIIGLLYGALLALFFFVSHMVFVAHVRGSGIRLGPNQFPELHARVVELAEAMEMEPPAAYVMQAGGALNAFATRFLRRNIVVLFSDLIEACGDDDGARDMIIAHELAHIRCGHLDWMWFMLPGHLVPFLGSALSRAREYTCDRFGLAGAGSTTSALRGLAILSAGPRFASRVNLAAFVDQREDLNTGLMTLGEWLGSHPPLSRRIAALDASVAQSAYDPTRGRALAVAILLVVFVGGGLATVTVATVGIAMLGSLVDPALLEQQSGRFDESGLSFSSAPDVLLDPAQARATVDRDFQTLATFISARWDMAAPPESMSAVRIRWQAETTDPFPTDPFDGLEYGYDPLDGGFRLWSSGPDGEPLSEDDIIQTHPRG